MNGEVPSWVEIVVGGLLATSGVFTLVSGLGLVRLREFFQRMHPPALAYTFGTWCVCLAGIIYFSTIESSPRLHPLLVVVMLAITVPVTTVLLARAVLLRYRTAGVDDTPAPLSTRSDA